MAESKKKERSKKKNKTPNKCVEAVVVGAHWSQRSKGREIVIGEDIDQCPKFAGWVGPVGCVFLIES